MTGNGSAEVDDVMAVLHQTFTDMSARIDELETELKPYEDKLATLNGLRSAYETLNAVINPAPTPKRHRRSKAEMAAARRAEQTKLDAQTTVLQK